MNYKLIFTSLILSLFFLQLNAQESAIYRDYQENYKRGMNFFDKKLYGQALEAFNIVTSAANLFQDTDVPMYILQSELHAGLAALFTKQADAEKRLLTFIDNYDPSPVATKARLAIGNHYYDKRQYTMAIKYLSKVPNLDLNNAEIIEKKFKLGYCYFVKKKFEQAKTLFYEIKEVKTQYYYPSNYYYGITNFFEKEYDEALQSFKRVQNSKKYSSIVPSYICQIYFALKQHSELIKYGEPLANDKNIIEREQISQLIGQAYFEQGAYEKALPFLESYVEYSRKVTKETLYQLGYTQYKIGKHEEAIENFRQLNALKDKMGQSALYNMADCLLKTGKKSPARQAFQKASQMTFDPILQEDALINYAKLSYELGFDNDAISALQKVTKNKSEYYNEAQNLLSKIFLNTRDYDTALEYLRQMPEKTQKIKETHQKIAYFRALQLFNDFKYPKAITLFDESIKIGINQETLALAHFWKAESLYKRQLYDKSIDEYFQFNLLAKTANQLPANSTIGVANYGLGYNYLKKEDYGNASRSFIKAVSEIKPHLNSINDRYVTNFVYPDALLRSADCLLYLRDFSKAKEYYNTTINKNYPNKDYAMYQVSLIHNLQDKTSLQIAILDRLINNYPTSLYADNALYSKGNTYLHLDQKDLAIEAYKELVEKYPNSETANQAMLKLGLIAYSMDKNEEALNYYKSVFNTNPQSEEAKDALSAIKEIYIESGNTDGYFDFVKSIQGYSIDELERDSLMFVSAQIQFENNNWEDAVSRYTKYLERYPNGMNNIQARFNRGESLFDLKRYEEAILDYAYISDNGNPAYAETANYRAANITYYSIQDFSEASKYFGRLENLASTEERLFEAQQYGMRAAYYATKFDTLINTTERFINNPRTTPQDHAEANYYLGKSYLSQKKYDDALKAFDRNIELSGDDVLSAESRYWRAYIFYQKRELDNALDICFKNNKEIPGHPYWLVKSFILLADIYAEKGNLFQAKATLQSIVDNYDGDQDLIDEAKSKLQLVIDAEENKSKIKRINPDDDLEMIEENTDEPIVEEEIIETRKPKRKKKKPRKSAKNNQ
ncbi:MAG: tetratricopeptide repeat protein [Saprospiraceae bacterium]|nr:tetratricopeptide repeat protein [Saprospiraceae bacterium]